MTNIGTLAREIGVGERELRRAARQGTIHVASAEEHESELLPSERAYIVHAWPLLAALRSALLKERDIRFALLFGSMSRGEEYEGSDIDLVVDLRNPTLDRIIALEMRLSDTLGRQVEVVRLEDALSAPGLLEDIVTFGRVLVDRNHAWPELLSRAPSLVESGRKLQRQQLQSAFRAIDELLAR